MIVVSLLLILVAVTLLVMGLVGGSSTLLISSIAASLLAAIALVVGARQAAAARRAAAQSAPAEFAEMPAMAGASAGRSTASRRRGRRPQSDPGAFLNDPPPSDEGLDSLGAMQARVANRDDAEAALEADAAYREEEASGSAEGFYPRTYSSGVSGFAESGAEGESAYSEGRPTYADREHGDSDLDLGDLSHDGPDHGDLGHDGLDRGDLSHDGLNGSDRGHADLDRGDLGHGSEERGEADSDISDSVDASAGLSDSDRFADPGRIPDSGFSGRGYVADTADDPSDVYDYDGDLSHGSDDALLGETRADSAAGWAAAGTGEPYPDYDRASSFIGGARSENPAGNAWRTGHADDTPADLDERPASQGRRGPEGSDEFGVPDEDDPADEPLPQAVSPADAVRVARMAAEVLVVDGRPRYHVADCPHLEGRQTEGLPAAEAVELGFSPCGLCRPVDRLVAQSAHR